MSRIVLAAVKLSMFWIESLGLVVLSEVGRAGRSREYRIASFEALVVLRMLVVSD